MKKRLFFLSLISALLLVGAGCDSNYQSQTNLKLNNTEIGLIENSATTKNTTTNEQIIDIFLQASKEKSESIAIGDINQNGKTDYLIQAVSTECVSCHSRPFYLFEDGKIIFTYHGDDYKILQTTNNKIIVREPIRLDAEPMCCPSTFQITTIECPDSQENAYCLIKNTVSEIIQQSADDNLSNNNYYTNSAGNTIHSPAYELQQNVVPAGATAQCSDGTYSFSQSRRGTCSHHGGVSEWLN